MDGVERLYHEIACPSLTKTGDCNCRPVIVADGDRLCGCGYRESLHHVARDEGSVYCQVAKLRHEAMVRATGANCAVDPAVGAKVGTSTRDKGSSS